MYSPTKKSSSTINVIFTLRGIQRRLGGGRLSGPPASIALMLARLHTWAKLPCWSDGRRTSRHLALPAVGGAPIAGGVPLATIVVATAVAIGLLDLNAALVVGLWVLRKIVLYVVVAFFITLLLTPATRFLKRQGISHGLAATLVFLGGLVISAAWCTSSPRRWSPAPSTSGTRSPT
jgi:hypothetical protein